MTKFERILITKTPLAILVNKSKHIHPPGFEGVPLYDVIRFFYKQIKTHGITERASAISYNFIMAIPPSLLFIFTLIPNLPFISKRAIRTQLNRTIHDVIPSTVYNKELIKFVDSFIYDNRIGLLSIGLLVSLYFASNGIMGLIRSFNRKNYIGFEKRMGIAARWVAIKLTMLIFALFVCYFILLVSQGAILKWLVKSEYWRDIISNTRWIFIVLLIFFAIGFIFKYAPSVEKRWKLNSPGTITTTILSLLSSYGFSYFVTNFSKYNLLYGSIGTIMMIMALIYINSLAILIGFELNVSISSLKIIATNRNEKHHEILHSASQNNTDQQPKQARQITHLCCQHGADQRTSARNRCEMMAEQHIFVGRHIVQAVIQTHGRCEPIGIQTHHVFGDVQGIKAVGNQVNRYGRSHDPQGVDALALGQCNNTQ